MSGNGTDLGHLVAMVGQVLQGQETLGRRLDGMDRRLDDLTHQVAGLRQTVVEYHSSVLGHGVLISELDERLRRVERHLGLSPAA